jgi:hypothetical protein
MVAAHREPERINVMAYYLSFLSVAAAGRLMDLAEQLSDFQVFFVLAGDLAGEAADTMLLFKIKRELSCHDLAYLSEAFAI